MQEAPLHASGVWAGQRMLPDGTAEAIQWSLTLAPRSAYPSAFGAAVAAPGVPPRLLKGTWEPTNRTLKLTDVRGGANGNVNYIGELNSDGDQLRGHWRTGEAEGGTERGMFIVQREEDDDDVHISGLWLGQAVPDVSLEPFLIPTNPIQWTITVLRQGDDRRAFGSGYFDDAADVPNQPVVFFTIDGTFQRDEGGDHGTRVGTVTVTKTYEIYDETQGYTVDYTGALLLEPRRDGSKGPNTWMLTGTWRNEKGGSFGNFTARRQHMSATASVGHICLCDKCHQPMKPGELRWSCSTCPTLWSCCAPCLEASGGAEATHPHPLTAETLYAMEMAKGACSAELAADALQRFGNRPFLGIPSGDAVQWINYNTVADQVWDVVRGLSVHQLRGRPDGSTIHPGGDRPFALLCADLCPSYAVVVLAGLLRGCVLLPIHGALDCAAIEHIITKTRPAVIFTAPAYEDTVQAAVKGSSVAISLLVVLSETVLKPDTPSGPAPLVAPPTHDGPTVVSLQTLRHQGRASIIEDSPPPPPVRTVPLEEVSAILYTSGSTGVPKGVVFNEELVLPSEGGATVQPFIRMDYQQFDPSFLLSLLSTMLCGGQRVFATDLTTLMADMQLARPTHLGATPVFWNALYQDFLSRVGEAKGDRSDAESTVANTLRQSLGNRLFVATSGGAPISKQVATFVRQHLRIDLVDLYGSREAGGISRDGVVYPAVDVRLLPVPDLGYTATGPTPQGEICVHSPRLVPGYWDAPDLNAAAFVEMDGRRYYRTGDIGEVETVKGVTRVTVIDRCSCVFKLSQGEWVSPGRVEGVLEECPWVHQALVLGSSEHSFTVAVIVPSDRLLTWDKENGDGGDTTMAAKLVKELRFWCVHHHLRPVEVPQAVHVERDGWTDVNKMMTSTWKKRRGPLQHRYAGVRTALYEGTHTTTCSGDTTVYDGGAFEVLLRQVLPANLHVDWQHTLAEIGGDSLCAARLVNLLKSHGVMVSVTAVFEYPLGHIAGLYNRTSMDGGQGTSYASPDIISKGVDWSTELNLPTDLPSRLPSPPQRRTILVTGCTGFLGPVLLREIRQQYGKEYHIIALVRGDTLDTATQRLQRDCTTAGVSWGDVNVTVMCGDLALPRLGFTDADYDRTLQSGLCCIYHSGARVNMAMPYSALRATNVGGTITVIRLAMATGASIHFVSSVGALPAGEPPSESFIPITPNQCAQKGGGYGQTKAVAERLLMLAHQIHGVEVTVYRPSAICGDTVTGFSNELDFTNLLLLSCITLGCAVHDTTFDLHWIPVDFVARSIVTLSRHTPHTQRVFHLNGVGPALCDVIRAVQSLGYTLHNVTTDEWHRRVTAAPNNTPDGKPSLGHSAAAALKHVFAAMQFPSEHSVHPANDVTRATLKTLGVEWPTVGTDVILRYAAYLRGRDFFPPPPPL